MSPSDTDFDQLEALIRETDDELGQLRASLERLREAFEASGACECSACRRAVWIDEAALRILCALLTKPHNLSRAEMRSNAIGWAVELRGELDAFHG